nr:hypothetical protein GCM10020093_101580 [Planobispora longispora]
MAGRDTTAVPAVRRARAGLRRTFQRTQVFGRLTVADNVLAAMEWRGGGGGLLADLTGWPARRRLERERRRRVDEVLALCGLTELRDAYAASLPVGQRRLVELARALADDPALLLLDEPTSGLDADQTTRLGEVVRSLDTTTLLVEHDMGFVMEVCDRLVVLDLGEVIAVGTPPRSATTPPCARPISAEDESVPWGPHRGAASVTDRHRSPARVASSDRKTCERQPLLMPRNAYS